MTIITDLRSRGSNQTTNSLMRQLIQRNQQKRALMRDPIVQDRNQRDLVRKSYFNLEILKA